MVGRSGTSMLSFNAFISRGGLMNLPLNEGRYTWSNRQKSPILSRLGRFLVNVNWEEEWPRLLHP